MPIKILKEDRLFSDWIRERDHWTCTRCGKYYPEGERQGLHCSHFWGRGEWATRLDPKNATAHCYGCHQYLTARPEEFRQWKLKRIGKDEYKKLTQRAHKNKPKAQAIKEFYVWYSGGQNA